MKSIGEWDGFDWFIGVVFWLTCIVVMATEAGCVQDDNCNAFDIVLFAILGVSFLISTYFFVGIVGALRSKK